MRKKDTNGRSKGDYTELIDFLKWHRPTGKEMSPRFGSFDSARSKIGCLRELGYLIVVGGEDRYTSVGERYWYMAAPGDKRRCPICGNWMRTTNTAWICDPCSRKLERSDMPYEPWDHATWEDGSHFKRACDIIVDMRYGAHLPARVVKKLDKACELLREVADDIV